MTTTTTTTTVASSKPNWAAAVSAVVAAAISTGIHFWTKVDVGWVAAFALPIGYAYHWLISEGEKKFPWLSVFFLALPPKLPTPTPAPTPTPSSAMTMTYVETPNGNRWAADVNTMEKAEEVTKNGVTKAAQANKNTPKTKRTSGR